jgi:hypothetical protein
MKRNSTRTKNMVSLLGDGVLSRGYYVCADCKTHAIPKDLDLDIEGTGFTPGVRRAVSWLASSESFEWSSETLKQVGGVSVSAKECQRIAEETGAVIEDRFNTMKTEVLAPVKAGCDGIPVVPPEKTIPIMYISLDGTGIPMRKSELVNRKGKQQDGSAVTREVKLGCVFTQTRVDDEGNPVRDDESTSYFGAIENSEQFGNRLYTHAVMRGMDRAAKLVVIGDGAGWIRNLGSHHFPDATLIVDLYHAKERVHKLIKKITTDVGKQKNLQDEWIGLLDSGHALELSEKIKSYPVSDADLQNDLVSEAGYFSGNADRMRYDLYRKEDLFVGSGVIEAGCKTVIGKRLKQSGMFWSLFGANSTIALRCAVLSCNANLDGYS